MEKSMSIFDLFKIPANLDQMYSPAEINKIVMQLLEAKSKASKRETAERERRKAREKEEQERAIREQEQQHIQEVTSMELPLDWNNTFDNDDRAKGVHYDRISDAMIHCLATLGKVDIEYIASVTGADYKTVIETLKGSIYQNPDTWEECFYKGWETADEYLSGNLRRKLKSAREADRKYNGYFSDNVAAIIQVMPPAVASNDIYVTLGSPWVPTDIIDEFMEHLFGDPMLYIYCRESEKRAIRERYQTKHDELTGTWEIPNKTRYNHSVAVSNTWGTDKMEALHILEKTLNMKAIAIHEEISCSANASGKKKVINKTATFAAIEKQKKLIQEFQKWIWEDPKRKRRLESIFEDKYGCVRSRRFDGSFLEFPTMSKAVQLYPYQKDAVARNLFTPNTLLAHDVGAGKTYVMIAAGQEARRMGLSKKNMYVVPNNIVGQWEKIFHTMYPDAKLLCVDPKSFVPDKRDGVLERIKNEDFDGIIIAYSCFEQIPLSKEYYLEELEARQKEIGDIVSQKSKATSRLKAKKDKMAEILKEMTLAMEDLYDSYYFDELGITRLFVDEAHNYKNVPLDTKADNVLGISSSGSKKCADMLDKVHMIQKKNEGKGVVMATGTPITNSITDAYVMQQYLQSGELAMLDLQSFDSWIGMFAEKQTEFEIDVDTNSYRLATRFSKFHNMTELTSLLALIADFHHVDERDGVPSFDGREDVLIEKTQAFSDYLKEISSRADDVRSGNVNRREDNMLKITTDGRKAALDLRLVDSLAYCGYESKVVRCAENVAEIYLKTKADRSARLIFCDTSTPKADFNIYDELKKHLIAYGIPEEEIAYIHDAETERKRSKLFKQVRNGEIRILIGSTFKLGLGVNVQDRLIALHHIDIPWRPADMTQREGRILRQGNRNKKVSIYRYITKGSFDAYSWQLLETKQRFISDLLAGSLSERESADIEDTVLDYAEVKALAVGNPLVKERVEAQNELSRYQTLQRKAAESRMNLETELTELVVKIIEQKHEVETCEQDSTRYERWKAVNPPAETKAGKEQEAEQRKLLRETLNQAVKENILIRKERVLTQYRGFDIVLPANMNEEKPFIWLCGAGRNYLEMGDTQKGNLMRIDIFLENLQDRLRKLRNGLSQQEGRERSIRDELAREENYTDKITELKRKVKELDERLGVKRE